MQTLTSKQQFEQDNSTTVEDLVQNWRVRLVYDCPKQSAKTRESIIRWLVGDIEQFESLDRNRLEIIQKGMLYRYSILQQRYLGRSPQQAYRNLIARLYSLVVLRLKIRSWVLEFGLTGSGNRDNRHENLTQQPEQLRTE